MNLSVYNKFVYFTTCPIYVLAGALGMQGPLCIAHPAHALLRAW